jgi:hypothetical protein
MSLTSAVPAPTTIIVSGFPGIGKSSYVTSVRESSSGLSVSDSDSSKFPKTDFPANYLRHIERLIGNVHIILVSSHDQVRDALVGAGHRFLLVYPSGDQKEEYLERYRTRGSPDVFVTLMDARWDDFITGCENQTGCDHIVLEPGEYLSDAMTRMAEGGWSEQNSRGVPL